MYFVRDCDNYLYYTYFALDASPLVRYHFSMPIYADQSEGYVCCQQHVSSFVLSIAYQY